jgi:hypothetical protein
MWLQPSLEPVWKDDWMNPIDILNVLTVIGRVLSCCLETSLVCYKLRGLSLFWPTWGGCDVLAEWFETLVITLLRALVHWENWFGWGVFWLVFLRCLVCFLAEANLTSRLFMQMPGCTCFPSHSFQLTFKLLGWYSNFNAWFMKKGMYFWNRKSCNFEINGILWEIKLVMQQVSKMQ